MPFEAEVIPLFIGGASIVCVLELLVGCVMLKDQKAARNRLIGHAASTAIAPVFLVRFVFSNWLAPGPGIASISNSVSIGLLGVFWAVGVFFPLSVISAITDREKPAS